MFRKSSNNAYVPGTINRAYDATRGGGDEVVGTRYPGLLGQTIVLNNADALKVSYTSTGTLYQGIYQYVKFATAVTRGELLFWDTLANNGMADFEVTHTVTAATAFRAGVCLLTDASATGKYGWIQVAGLANMLYGNSAPGTIGLEVIQATAADTPLLTVATVNTSADATAQLTEDVRAVVGLAYETPAQAGVRRVWMNLMGFYPNIG
jgi:hypothetical protein